MGSAEADTGIVKGVARAVGTMVGAHLQYAQREAASDAGRVVGGVGLIVGGGLAVAFALLMLHVAGYLLLRERTLLSPLGAALAVAGVDGTVAVMLLLMGRARLRKPVLAQTRRLVRETVSSLAEMGG